MPAWHAPCPATAWHGAAAARPPPLLRAAGACRMQGPGPVAAGGRRVPTFLERSCGLDDGLLPTRALEAPPPLMPFTSGAFALGPLPLILLIWTAAFAVFPVVASLVYPSVMSASALEILSRGADAPLMPPSMIGRPVVENVMRRSGQGKGRVLERARMERRGRPTRAHTHKRTHMPTRIRPRSLAVPAVSCCRRRVSSSPHSRARRWQHCASGSKRLKLQSAQSAPLSRRCSCPSRSSLLPALM